jgi:hypothetical protein
MIPLLSNPTVLYLQIPQVSVDIVMISFCCYIAKACYHLSIKPDILLVSFALTYYNTISRSNTVPAINFSNSTKFTRTFCNTSPKDTNACGRKNQVYMPGFQQNSDITFVAFSDM